MTGRAAPADHADILLVQPPIRDFYLTAKRTLPYGLASIAAVLRSSGFSVGILDGLATAKSRLRSLPEDMGFLHPYYGHADASAFSLFHQFRHYGYSVDHLASRVRAAGPFLVGISSLFTPYHQQALDTAEAIKRVYPKCFIVVGGHHPTRLPESVLASPAVDAVLRGEGEASMPQLAQALQHGESLDSVPGIVFRKADGSLFRSDPAWVGDLDALPLPALDLINRSFYSRKKRGSTVVVAGRGCPMGCSYCSLGASSDHARFRQRSVASVIRELECQLTTDDVGFIDFEDEHLTLNRAWFMALLGQIRERFGSRDMELRAMNGLYPPSLDDAMVGAMKSAGFRTLNLSLGSTSREQLKRFNRPDVRSAFDNALALAQKHGLEAVSYLIAAAPGQDPLGSVDDLLFLAERRTLVGLSVFYPAPGSRMYAQCRDQGLLPDNLSLMRSTALPVSDTTTRLQAATLLRLSRILNFMKAMTDAGRPAPDPMPFSDRVPLDPKDREGTGIRLLQGFLHDGIIRGITLDGNLVTHDSDAAVTERFVRGLSRLSVRGVRS